MDLETGVRLGIPVLTIVLNNQVLSGYPARYETAVELYGFTELYGEYANVATALGAYGERISDPAENRAGAAARGGGDGAGTAGALEFMTKEENTLARYPAL